MAMLAERKQKVKWCLNPRGNDWAKGNHVLLVYPNCLFQYNCSIRSKFDKFKLRPRSVIL